MTFSNLCNEIFWKSTTDYHVTDSVDAPMNPYELKTIEYYLYLKNWIDAVQWHFEDIIMWTHTAAWGATAAEPFPGKTRPRWTVPPRICAAGLPRWKPSGASAISSRSGNEPPQHDQPRVFCDHRRRAGAGPDTPISRLWGGFLKYNVSNYRVSVRLLCWDIYSRNIKISRLLFDKR